MGSVNKFRFRFVVIVTGLLFCLLLIRELSEIHQAFWLLLFLMAPIMTILFSLLLCPFCKSELGVLNLYRILIFGMCCKE